MSYIVYFNESVYSSDFEILQKFDFKEELLWQFSKPLNLFLGHMSGGYLVRYAVSEAWHISSRGYHFFCKYWLWYHSIVEGSCALLKNPIPDNLSRVSRKMFKLSKKDLTWRNVWQVTGNAFHKFVPSSTVASFKMGASRDPADNKEQIEIGQFFVGVFN